MQIFELTPHKRGYYTVNRNEARHVDNDRQSGEAGTTTPKTEAELLSDSGHLTKNKMLIYGNESDDDTFEGSSLQNLEKYKNNKDKKEEMPWDYELYDALLKKLQKNDKTLVPDGWIKLF
jgi:hypothetical protein